VVQPHQVRYQVRYCLTVVCRTRESNSNDKPKPRTKFEVSSSSSFEDMFDRMPKIVGLGELGHAHF